MLREQFLYLWVKVIELAPFRSIWCWLQEWRIQSMVSQIILKRGMSHWGVICFIINVANTIAETHSSSWCDLFWLKAINTIAKCNASFLCYLLHHQVINTIAKSNIAFFVLFVLSPNYKHPCKEQCFISMSSCFITNL